MKLNSTASPILVSSLDGTSLALAAQETTPRQRVLEVRGWDAYSSCAGQLQFAPLVPLLPAPLLPV